MQKLTIFFCIILLTSCTMFKNRTAEIAQQARDEAIKNMKFEGTGDMKKADAECRQYVTDSCASIAITGNFYAVQSQATFRDCMATKGFKCIEDCYLTWDKW